MKTYHVKNSFTNDFGSPAKHTTVKNTNFIMVAPNANKKINYNVSASR